MLKNKTTEQLIEEITQLGLEIEAEYYNTKFGFKAMPRLLREKAYRRLEILKSRTNISKIEEENEEFEYAMQFM